MVVNKVFINGNVITVDNNNTIQSAIAIKGNKIFKVGSDEEMKGFIDNDNPEVIDLKGRSLLPGFIDAHLHMVLNATIKVIVDAKAPHIKTLNDLFEDLSQLAGKTKKGDWVRAWGFDQNTIAEKRYPTISELNEISTEHPIIVMRTDGHHSIVNDYAFEIAEITKDTPDPQGGEYQKDQEGNLTGLLIESAHMDMFDISGLAEEEKLQAMRLAAEEYKAYGITTIHDAGGHGEADMRVMQRAVKEGFSDVRINIMLCNLSNSGDYVKKMTNSGIMSGLGNEKVRIGPVKLFTDGASIIPTMATRKPYLSNNSDCGILYYEKNELYKILVDAHKKGFQITAHSQGDRAIEMLLDVYEELLEEYPREDHRHRIEHAGLSTPDLVERMKKLKVIPIPNPNLIYEYGEIYLEHIGDRADSLYPIRSFIDNEIIAVGASDHPASTSVNPLIGIHAAVNRRTKKGTVVGESQKISILEAIRLYTSNASYVSFEEDIKGSIEEGKLADIIILNTNIQETPDEEIKDVKVDMTVIDGKTVYER